MSPEARFAKIQADLTAIKWMMAVAIAGMLFLLGDVAPLLAKAIL